MLEIVPDNIGSESVGEQFMNLRSGMEHLAIRRTGWGAQDPTISIFDQRHVLSASSIKFQRCIKHASHLL